MAYEVILPKQGMYDGDVELIEWIAPDGSHISQGEPLFLLGTDKVEVEVLAENDGWLIRESPDGQIAPVGTRVGRVVDSADELP